MEEIEGIILRHSRRGMSGLSDCMPGDFCAGAAREVLTWSRGCVAIATGFCVAGHAETDGPPGAAWVARALEELGFAPVIVTDALCRGLFERENLSVEYVGLDAEDGELRGILERLRPVGMISIERCGRTAQGDYLNMRGVDIGTHTAPVDRLAGQLAERLGIRPCAVRTDRLIIATVSNWGAYGLCAALERLSRRRCLPSPDEAERQIERMVAQGCVDGISHMQTMSVDGFYMATEAEILDALRGAIGRQKGEHAI